MSKGLTPFLLHKLNLSRSPSLRSRNFCKIWWKKENKRYGGPSTGFETDLRDDISSLVGRRFIDHDNV